MVSISSNSSFERTTATARPCFSIVKCVPLAYRPITQSPALTVGISFRLVSSERRVG